MNISHRFRANEYPCVRCFRNGNINIRFTEEILSELKSDKYSVIEVLSWELERADCYFIGDEFCISNYEMGALIYNAYSDVVYILMFSDILNILAEGKTLKLYGHEPSDSDRELLRAEGVN